MTEVMLTPGELSINIADEAIQVDAGISFGLVGGPTDCR